MTDYQRFRQALILREEVRIRSRQMANRSFLYWIVDRIQQMFKA